MKLLLTSIFCLFTLLLSAQSNTDRINQLDAAIKAAVAAEDYEKASLLKKEKEKRLEIEKAVADSDYEKAARLKAELEGKSTANPSEKASDVVVRQATVPKKQKKKENSKWQTTKFETYKDPAVKPPFPAMRICDDDRYVNPIGIINGIEIGYYMDVDSDIDFDGYSDTDYDITLVFRNLTGKELYFNNRYDLVGQVKFTGEEVSIDVEGGYIDRLGGKCPFYAEFLDQEEGRYVMYPDEDYYGDYTINQSTEGWLEMIWLRRMKPLWMESFVPAAQYSEQAETNVIFFPDADLSKSSNQNINGFVSRRIKLPNKRIECTFAERGLSLKKPLPRLGEETILFENDKLRLSYYIDKDKGTFKKEGGYYKYPLTISVHNKSDAVFNPADYGKSEIIGYLKFHNSYSIPIRVAKKDRFWWEMVKIPPGGTHRYTQKMFVTLYSGELLVGTSISKRALETTREMIPSYIKMRKKMIQSAGDVAEQSNDGKTKINVFVNPASPKEDPYYEAGKERYYNYYNNESDFNLYFGMDEQKVVSIRSGDQLTYQFSGARAIDFFMGRGFTIKSKVFAKLKKGATPANKAYKKIDLKEGQELYLLIRYSHRIEFVSKEVFDDFVLNSSIKGSKKTMEAPQ